MSIATLSKKLVASVQALTMVAGLSVIGVGAVSLAAPAVTHAAITDSCTATDPTTATNPLTDGAKCAQSKSSVDNLFGANGLFKTIANTMIYIIGAIAVLFLILGGLRYVTSNGDPKNVTAAKDTILYAIIGIVVAILSFAAVNFVIGALSK